MHAAPAEARPPKYHRPTRSGRFAFFVMAATAREGLTEEEEIRSDFRGAAAVLSTSDDQGVEDDRD